MRTVRLFVLAGLCGCWGSSSYFPVPTGITDPPGSIGNGSSVGAGVETGATQIFVLGYFFDSETVIQWDGRAQKTTFIGPAAADPLQASGLTEVRVDLDADATRVAGTSKMTASRGGSAVSQPLDIQVIDALFTVTGVSPTQSALGAGATTFTLTGTGFRPDSTVFFDGTPLTVNFVSSTSVTMQVPASMLTEPGDRVVQAFQEPCSSTDPSFCPQQLAAAPGLIVAAGPTGTRSKLDEDPIEMVWDATHSLLFAATPRTTLSDVDFNLFPIDPATGTAGSVTAIQAFEGFQMKTSAGDQFLYVLQGDFDDLERFSLPDLTTVTAVPGNQLPQAIAPSPDAALTVAFAGEQAGIIDGTAQRPTLSSNLAGTPTAIAWGADANTLYALANTLVILHADASGIVSTQPVPTVQFGVLSDLVFDRTTQRVYGSDGENLDAQGGDPRPFALFPPVTSTGFIGFSDCRIAIDSRLGKGFFACNEGPRLTVRSFDLASQKFIARIVLETAPPTGNSSAPRTATPNRLVRWGADGLAVATAAGLYLYNGPFVH
jgi:hypothetical protein